MTKTYIGIDNGVTGTVSIITNTSDVIHFNIPIQKELSYTKKKQYITRIDYNKLIQALDNYGNCFCLLERPMINPMRWKASMSAIRALEATLISLERLAIPYQYIDSREWQKELLPKNLFKNKGKDLKFAALDIAKRLFPQINTKDADSLLIAEYARRKGL